MKQYKVGVVGCTGMVGQRFVTLMENHPWFQLTVVAASARSAGKTYEEAVSSRWAMDTPIPEEAKKLVVMDATADIDKIASSVDFVFCAVDMKKDEIRALEEEYARHECPVVSNNSAHRFTPDVPMVVPEINPEHLEIIPAQRKRLGTKRGFIAVKSNCSLQSYVPAIHPLRQKYGMDKVLVCTYQAISGAGKTFETWPEMIDNVIPYIGGEEKKSEQEPMKLWGKVDGDHIACACLSRTVIWLRCLCPSPRAASPLWRKSAPSGQTTRAAHRNSRSPPLPSSFSTTLKRTTGPRPSRTGCWKAVWPSPSAGCERILSMTTNLSASLTTRCGAPPAALSCWLNCCAPRAIWKGIDCHA